MKQDDRVCMYYIAERLTDILKMKNKDKAFKCLYEFKDEIIHNLGTNAFYNRYIKEGKE
jgi:hypothetical protein